MNYFSINTAGGPSKILIQSRQTDEKRTHHFTRLLTDAYECFPRRIYPILTIISCFVAPLLLCFVLQINHV